jgi:hypothetical protein
MSLALRIAHDLNAYHRLDSEIVLGYGSAQLEDNPGNTLIIGNPASPFLAKMLQGSETPFRVENARLVIKDTIIDEAGLGMCLPATIFSFRIGRIRHPLPPSAP